MNIFFDVDHTLITWDYRLRPFVREVFARLCADGHAIYLWSGRGRRWEVVQRFRLERYVAGCFDKPLYDHAARLHELGIDVYPDFVIDDHPEPVAAFGGYHIPEPREPLETDDEMWRVYAAICRYHGKEEPPFSA
jgi:FMN phosphatase YigB (HAD superfamily)